MRRSCASSRWATLRARSGASHGDHRCRPCPLAHSLMSLPFSSSLYGHVDFLGVGATSLKDEVSVPPPLPFSLFFFFWSLSELY